MRKWFGLALVALLFSGPIFGQDAASQCRLNLYAAVPMTLDKFGLVTIPMTISGQPLTMLVDTGAYFSTLNEDVTDRLGLRRSELQTMYLQQFGGTKLNHRTVARDLNLSGITLKNKEFAVMPGTSPLKSVDGLLGEEFLRMFDLDFDFSAGKLNLFSHDHCNGMVMYWPHGASAEIPFTYNDNRHIAVVLQLDGKTVNAIIDTGSSVTVLSSEWAVETFGLDAAAVENSDNHVHFKKIELSGVTVENPAISLVSDKESKILEGHRYPMIVGINVLRKLHLYIAYHEHKIYVTPASSP
jgi:predicted aspartyl protease